MRKQGVPNVLQSTRFWLSVDLDDDDALFRLRLNDLTRPMPSYYIFGGRTVIVDYVTSFVCDFCGSNGFGF